MLRWGPGWRGTGAQPIRRTPVEFYTRHARGIDLHDGDVQGTIPGGGVLTLTAAPQGLGTVWYPTQVTLSTTTGPLDTSTAQVWMGAGQVPVELVATVFSGNGTIGLAIPQLSPGQSIIVKWTGANPGDIAGAHVVGTMDALLAM